MHISIVGAGYVGLVSGVCLAEKGHRVICVDLDQQQVDCINRGMPPIYEKGLETLLKQNIDRRLTATTDLRQAVLDTELSMIAVGTPFDDHEIDLQYVKDAARQIGTALRNKPSYHLVVVKSTVIPGTTDDVVRPLLEACSGKRAGVDFGVSMNPEFLREGEAIQDFMYPDRIVLGGIDEASLNKLEQLYRVFEGVELLRTNCRTAEMIKYTANSLLATLISFSNEIGNLCAASGDVDVVDVMKGVQLDKRFTPILPNGHRITPAFTTYLEAGCGFGGSCFPKDIKALIAYGRHVKSPMRVLEAVIDVNIEQPGKVLALVKQHFPILTSLQVAVLGLAFKPGTDDVRESPSLPVIQALLSQGATVKAYDPVATDAAQRVLGEGQLIYCDDLAQAVEAVHAILLMTRWPELQQIPDLIAHLEPPPLVIDARRMLDKQVVARYAGIGL